MENADIKYLKVLATQYPNIAAAATEIVNLKAILSLPKATEHFITDVHGEYEQFRHVMCNGSGAVQRKIEDEFGSSLGIPEKRTLATLIYYPELKIKQIEGKLTQRENLEDWYKVTIFRLIRVCKNASSKYTRSKPAKEDKRKMARPVLYQITDVFKGRKGKGANDSGGFDLLRLRLKHKEIKQKRQELHHFLHHRGDLHGSGQGVRPIQRGDEGVDIGGKQARSHSRKAKEKETGLTLSHTEGGDQKRRHHAEKHIFYVCHGPTAFLTAGSSPKMQHVSRRSHQKEGPKMPSPRQKQPEVQRAFSAAAKHKIPM